VKKKNAKPQSLQNRQTEAFFVSIQKMIVFQHSETFEV
jgi:hypothetical protein